MVRNIRNNIFWIIDAIKGYNVKKHYKNVKELNNQLNDNFIQKINDKKLDKICKHAINTVSFYKKLDIKQFEDFPILSKKILRENIDLFISEKFDKNKLIKGSTSGTSGTPFVFYKNIDKKYRNDADFIYYYEKGGYVLGNPLYYFRIWNSKNIKSPFQTFMQNIKMIDTKSLSPEKCKEIISVIKNDNDEKFILSFASSIEMVANNLEESNLKVKSIFTCSEVLTDVAREKIKNKFGCSVYSRYSNQENGLLAQQFNDSNLFEINRASFKIEIIDLKTNLHVNSGESGRVVVTDLYNYGMPFIRYDTEDIATYFKIDGREYLSTIEGRIVDFIMDTQGNLLSPYTISMNIWGFYEDIKQFQFIQKEKKKYVIKIIPAKINVDIENIRKTYMNILGNDALIDIKLVESIEIEKSGKFKLVINECKF